MAAGCTTRGCSGAFGLGGRRAGNIFMTSCDGAGAAASDDGRSTVSLNTAGS